MIRAVGFLCVVLVSPTALAVTVNRCQSDVDSAPGGTNLATALAQGGLITFACGSQTIPMTRSYWIVDGTEINGGGTITLDGKNKQNLFFGRNGASLSLVDLEIVNAGPKKLSGPVNLPGTAVRGHLNLHIVRSRISNSRFPIWLYDGSVRSIRSRFLDNSGTVLHAKIIDILDGSQLHSNGLGISTTSTGAHVVIEDTEFVSNGPSFLRACELRIRRSKFNANVGADQGGALQSSCSGVIEDSEFRNNRSLNGAAIYVTGGSSLALRNVEFHDNLAKGSGGAIAVAPGQSAFVLELQHVRFAGNQAAQGGAIDLGARELKGAAVAFVRNRADKEGGAIHASNAVVRLRRGFFFHNVAGDTGGAVAAVQLGQLRTEFANSLFVDNSANSGAAFWGSSATFINTSFILNGGDAIQPATQTGPISFSNTLLWSGVTSPCAAATSPMSYQDLGHNLQFPGTDCGPGIVSAFPWLGPKYVPTPWSPARNAGNNTVCNATPIEGRDFFGVRRPEADNCSIGAVEGNVSHLEHRRKREKVPST